MVEGELGVSKELFSEEKTNRSYWEVISRRTHNRPGPGETTIIRTTELKTASLPPPVASLRGQELAAIFFDQVDVVIKQSLVAMRRPLVPGPIMPVAPRKDKARPNVTDQMNTDLRQTK